MNFELDRWGLVITPESEQDVAFLEDTMGLKQDGDYVKLRRVDSHNPKHEFVLETDISIQEEGQLEEETEIIALRRPKVDASQFKDWNESPYDEERSKSSNYTLVDIPAAED